MKEEALTVLGVNYFELKICELFFPLEAPGSHRGGNPGKMGKNCKIPLPGPTPEIGENCPKKGVKWLRISKYNFCNFSVILPSFGGRTGEGNFVIFPIFRDFHPVASRANNSELKM